MGNLYTQYQRVYSPRIAILSKLKQAYGTTPRDYKLINELKAELKKVEAETKKRRKKWKGQYG